MKTTLDGTNIRLTDPHRHKYVDAMAEYLYGLDPDEQIGTVEWEFWAGLFSKRILCEDSQGFVWVVKHDSVAEARETWDAIEKRYSEWCEREEADA